MTRKTVWLVEKPKPLPTIQPCPFCGGREFIVADWFVECFSCCAGGPEKETERDAILAWNRRVEVPDGR